jgi:hypothetical protein
VQPGEIQLGSWLANIETGRLLTGKLTLTDRRLIFRPQMGGVGLLSMLLTQRKGYKDAHTIIIARDRITGVRPESGLVRKLIHVTTADGVTYSFGCNPWSLDEIVQALSYGLPAR